MAFKSFSNFSAGGHLVYRSGTISATFGREDLGTSPMTFEHTGPRAQQQLAFKANC